MYYYEVKIKLSFSTGICLCDISDDWSRASIYGDPCSISSHVGFVVDKVALRRVFPQVLQFPPHLNNHHIILCYIRV
jgi:hypothetical protein